MNKQIQWMALACCLTASAQIGSFEPGGIVPGRVVISVGHFYGLEPPAITARDLTITQGLDPREITRVTALRGDRASLELYLLVGDNASCEASTKFEEFRRFILSQPPTTAVGIAYIRAGQLEIAERPTLDRDRAVKALNVPPGSRPANPFIPLANLIYRWNQDPARNPQARRAILMFSNGIDPAASGALLDPSADAAIEAAQRAEVSVFALYNPSVDYTAASATEIYAGQVQLAHVANESGGEAYLLGFGPLPSLEPFLADIAGHLANQYLVEFLAAPREREGFGDITVKCLLIDVELMAPTRVWIEGAGTATSGE